jgi:hypothetical protein
MIERPDPWDGVRAVLSHDRALTFRIVEATCLDLVPFVCRAACCYDWEIPVKTDAERAALAPWLEPCQVDPRGLGRMRLGADGYCVENDHATRLCARHDQFRSATCSEAKCAMVGQTFEVTIRQVRDGV